MSILVVGSVAFDSLKSPEGERDEILGGSATYFSIAASYFTQVHMVAVVGEDFPQDHFRLLQGAGIDTRGVQVASGKTFRWTGSYIEDINDAKTLKTELNVLEQFSPKIPQAYQDDPYVLLANIDPLLQSDVLRQVKKPKFVMMDTMNLWIQIKKDKIFELLKNVQLFVVNEGEAKLLTGQSNLICAGRDLLERGPGYVIIKKGEYGAMLMARDGFFMVPAYPVVKVFDPTGAGDSFAGGFLGYLAREDKTDLPHLKRAMIYGSVMASFAVERFGLEQLLKLTEKDVAARYAEFKGMTSFE
jgi:sugar/nucleoside kinase (ribokinase family)